MSDKEIPPLRLEWRSAAELDDNPMNWRRHPVKQLTAIEGLLDDIGWAGAVLYNERTNRLIDGHARKEVSGKKKIPVLVGSWDEEQERLILATLDPITTLARPDGRRLRDLLDEVDSGDVAELCGQIMVLPPAPNTIDDGFTGYSLICPSCGKEVDRDADKKKN